MKEENSEPARLNYDRGIPSITSFDILDSTLKIYIDDRLVDTFYEVESIHQATLLIAEVNEAFLMGVSVRNLRAYSDYVLKKELTRRGYECIKGGVTKSTDQYD